MNVLSGEQRKWIINLYRDGEKTQIAIAQAVGTTQGNVSKVLAGARKFDPAIPIRRASCDARSGQRRMFAASQIGSRREPMDIDSL